MKQVFTIGHSTRDSGEFVEMLVAHGVEALADVRRYPASRRWPHFNAGEMAQWLPEAGIAYLPYSSLGGRRRALPVTESPNTGWENEGFRGYADYMQTEEFEASLNVFCVDAASPTAVMCAEALPWRCHRWLLADALIARGWTVTHIMGPDPAAARPHALREFAVVNHGRVSYPPPAVDAEGQHTLPFQ